MSIGLTKEHNLVILESHGGIMLFLAFPFFGGGGEMDYVFERIQ